MPTVAIQPSYGNPAARAHWVDTLDNKIPFQAPRYSSALDPRQLKALLYLHPEGRARFWGATALHDTKMDRLKSGDVVLFTGRKQVRAVGEIGTVFRNDAFADLLWSPGPDNGSWRNVYSLISFQPTAIPYEEVWDLPSFNAGDNFMGLRVLDEPKSDEIIDGLCITTTTSGRLADEDEIKIARNLAQQTRLLGPEAVRTLSTEYERDKRTILVHRVEAVLVKSYIETLGIPTSRIRTPVGVTDLHISGEEGDEIIEAKSSVDHEKVRQAVAQLLDYAPFSPRPLSRLSALFPIRPGAHDVDFLHRLGIDCIYLGETGYERLPAPDHRRESMRSAWSESICRD